MEWTQGLPDPGTWWLALPDQDRPILVQVIPADDDSLIVVGLGAARSIPLGVAREREGEDELMIMPQ